MAKRRRVAKHANNTTNKKPEVKKTKKTSEIKFLDNKYLKPAVIILLIGIAMFFSYDLRDNSAHLEITNTWAAQSIDNSIAQQASAVVNQQYPNLPQQQKNQRISEQVDAIKRQLGDQYTQQVEQQGAVFRERIQMDMPDGSKQTYLLAIDPYFHYRKTLNLLENGHPGDEIRDGKPWDTHMWAPIGSQALNEFHTVFSAFWHKIYTIFNPEAELLQSFFWVPVIISMLAVIPAFFIAYRRTNYLGGFISAMIVAVHPYFLTRTAAGFSDTDAYNVLFPLLITWVVIEAFTAKSLRNRLILGSIAGFTAGVFSFAWVGWWYIFDFVLIGMLIYLWYLTVEKRINKNDPWYLQLGMFLFYLVVFPYTIVLFLMDLYERSDWKNQFKKPDWKLLSPTAVTLTFFVSAMIFVSWFQNFATFIQFIYQPLGFTTIQSAAGTNLWPNVFTTVAELNRASLSQVISNVGFNHQGGTLFFFIGIMGIGFSFMKNQLQMKDWLILLLTAILGAILIQLLAAPIFVYALILVGIALVGIFLSMHRGTEVIKPLIITIWFIGTVYASTLGIRFILLVVPAFAVAMGYALGKVSAIIQQYAVKEFKFPYSKQVISILIFAIMLLFLIKPVTSGAAVGRNEVPTFDDAWYSSLKNIENISQEDAIINSWWDFGHWFKATADRAVTFDGASQNSPQAHWIGRVLSTDDEREALGILRMLDCGGRVGEELIREQVITPLTSIQLTKEIIMIDDREDARNVLIDAGIVNSAVQDAILERTHCSPPENYFITSGDMVGKSGVWSHFGNWDFRKAYIYNTVKANTPGRATTIIAEGLDVSEDVALSFVQEANGLNEQEANNWISPFAGYFGTNVFTCENQNGTIVCPIGLGLGSGGNNQANVLERVFFDTSNVSNTSATVGVYQNTGLGNQRIGEANAKPSGIVYTGQSTLSRINFEGNTLGVDVIIDTRNNRAFVSSPQVSQSTFTKLYFLGGYGMNNFELVSDATSVFGNRILVWKVNWPDEFLN